MSAPINLLIIDGTLRGGWDERFTGKGEPVIYSRLYLPPDDHGRERFFEVALVEKAARGWLGAKPDKATRVHCVGRLAVRFTRVHMDMKPKSHNVWTPSLAVEITEMETIK